MMTLLAPEIADLSDIGYSDADMEALKHAMRIAKFYDPLRAEQIQFMLQDNSWTAVAEFAAMCCQAKALGLKPWELPPCLAADEKGEQLLDRMLAAGLSQFEPDPISALKKAKAW